MAVCGLPEPRPDHAIVMAVSAYHFQFCEAMIAPRFGFELHSSSHMSAPPISLSHNRGTRATAGM